MARHKIHSPQNLPSLQSPDGTSRVNAWGTYKHQDKSVATRSKAPKQTSLLCLLFYFAQGTTGHTLPGHRKHLSELSEYLRTLDFNWRDETRRARAHTHPLRYYMRN
jgi:hypothetical protein